MAATKSVLLKLEVRPAGRKCYCAHSKKHEIVKGEPRLVVKAPGVATPEKGYCSDCGAKMLDKGQDALRLLAEELESASKGT